MIELDDVFVLYPVHDRQVAALRGLTLTVGAGERVVIAGPSGSGKSTLVKLVTGAVRPSAGRAMVLGHDLANASPRAILSLQRTGIGMITQQMSQNLAAELTGLQNVALQNRLTGKTGTQARRLALQMMERLGVAHLANARLAIASAGETQRLAIAAALAHRPRIIVADEPTGALDPANAEAVYDLLAELATELDAALLVVSHDPGAARIGQRTMVIRDGRVGAEQLSGAAHERLVVDRRGWLRLPESAREAAGITTRAVNDQGDHQSNHRVILRSPDDPIPADEQAVVTGPVTSPGAPRELVSLHAASRRIGSITVLPETTLAVSTGEVVVLAGRSGSGKTTVLSLMAGLSQPSDGSVTRSANKVAIASANPGFAESMSARANVVLAAQVRGQTIDAVFDKSVNDLLSEIGLSELAERAASTLSGGERQRLAIVRALSSDADLVLFDEPTSQLDQALARQVAELLRKQVSAERGIVCASHEPELLSKASRVVSFDRSSAASSKR